MKITATTKIIGIFGDPIAHSLSPIIHNAAFEKLGLNFAYLPFRVEAHQLREAVRAVRVLNLAGLNVTIPHKERILPLLDRMSLDAHRCRAVNTVVNKSQRLWGDNTDGKGFLRSLREISFSPRGQDVILIGAGGTARALLVALIGAGCHTVTVVNRTLSTAKTLVRQFANGGTTRLRTFPLEALTDPTLLKTAGLIVNVTPVGLHGEKFFPLNYAVTASSCLFYDVIYGVRDTSFLRPAHALRRPTMDGSRMLLHQAALAFTLWTRRPAPLEVMEEVLHKALAPSFR